MSAIATPLPATGFLRIKQIIGDPRAVPPIPPLVPVCPATWWAGVKTGRYPAAVKIGRRATAWKVEDVRALIERLGNGNG